MSSPTLDLKKQEEEVTRTQRDNMWKVPAAGATKGGSLDGV